MCIIVYYNIPYLYAYNNPICIYQSLYHMYTFGVQIKLITNYLDLIIMKLDYVFVYFKIIYSHCMLSVFSLYIGTQACTYSYTYHWLYIYK